MGEGGRVLLQEGGGMLEIWQDGVEYEFVRYGFPMPDEYIISKVGLQQWGRAPGTTEWPIFRPKPKRHKSYGVVWEETGEVRRAQHNDAWWDGEFQRVSIRGSYKQVLILRPVAIEEEA
jgi:hypothetical protein